MRVEMCEKNVVVVNKVTGMSYKVLEMEDNVATIAPIGIDGEVIDGEQLKITEENAIAFRFISNPNTPPIPTGITVVDGQLMRDGEQITEQGAIKVLSILATVPGKLLLAVKPVADNDLVDLFSYNVARDKFNKVVMGSIPMPTVVAEISDIKETKADTVSKVLLMFSKTHMEERENEKGEKNQVEIFDDARTFVYDGMSDSVRNNTYPGMPIEQVVVANDIRSVTDPAIGLIVREIETGENSLMMTFGAYDFMEDVIPLATDEVVNAIDINDNALIVRTSKEAKIYSEEGYSVHATMKTEEPLYLVDITRDGYDEVFTLVTYDATKVVTVTNKSTKDRGRYVVVSE